MIDNKLHRSYRRTGRTGRNLLKAVMLASSGKKVLVTGSNYAYTKDLQLKTMKIIEVTFGYHSMEITNTCVKIKDAGEINFTSHAGRGSVSQHFDRLLQACDVFLPDHYHKD